MDVDPKNAVINGLTGTAFVMLNKTFLRQLPTLAESVLLSELLSSYKYHLHHRSLELDDSFSIPLKYYRRQIGLSFYQQERAIKSLSQNGFITVQKRGFPATRFARLDFDVIFDLLNQPDPEVEARKKKQQFYDILNTYLKNTPKIDFQNEVFGNMQPSLKGAIIIVSHKMKKLGVLPEWTSYLTGRLRGWVRLKNKKKLFDFSLVTRTFHSIQVNKQGTFKQAMELFLLAARETTDVYYKHQRTELETYLKEVL